MKLKKVGKRKTTDEKLGVVKRYRLMDITKWNKKFQNIDNITNIFSNVISSKELKGYEIDINGEIRMLSTGNYDNKTNIDKFYVGEVIAIPSGGQINGSNNIKYHNGKFVNSGNLIASSLDNTKYSIKYIWYWMKQNKNLLQTMYRGSGIQHPDMIQILNVVIPIPPIEVQNKIVEILDKFTKLEAELEAELEARKKQYEYYRKKLLTFDEKLGGVVKIKDIFMIGRGRVLSKEYIRMNIGEYPIFSSQTENNGVFGKINTYDFDGEYLTWTTDGANAGTIFFRNGKFNCTNVCGTLKLKEQKNNLKYLFYILSINAKKYVNYATSNPKLMNNIMSEVIIPIPPIEVQNKIVEILDKFEILTNSSTEGLLKEIELRHKQYEYYRNKLLTFKS
ncbi:MAG: restriction endonuclease subunit S [Mycoplasmataceae bacterium]|nr:restriction endonuclease subunit S [Mycoplasmataceae bacterium]